MLMGGGGTTGGEQEAMKNMLPMMLMMMDDNEVDEDGNVVSTKSLSKYKVFIHYDFVNALENKSERIQNILKTLEKVWKAQ